MFFHRVYRLHQRWLELHGRLHNDLLPRLAARSSPGPEGAGVTMTRRTDLVTEVRLAEGNEAFRNIQTCLEWIENKQVGCQLEDSSKPESFTGFDNAACSRV